MSRLFVHWRRLSRPRRHYWRGLRLSAARGTSCDSEFCDIGDANYYQPDCPNPGYYIRVIIFHLNMLGGQQHKHGPPETLCKRIQNYVFRFGDLLGEGNFSRVYKAHHQLTNQPVAIKIIQLNSLKSQKLEELLFSEIDVLKKLHHPNILTCYQVFTSNRNCYIVTEICNGGDLESRLRRDGCFGELAVWPIVKDILEGLLYLAQRNVVHRDLKLANVFMHNGTAKIADFGFAKFTTQNFKDLNIGSPIYMSPQGLMHSIYGPKTDVWAFGVLIYELLHGQTPFSHCRSDLELKSAIATPLNPKKLMHQLSLEIKQLILACLETNEHRRASIFELAKLPYFQKNDRNYAGQHRSVKETFNFPVTEKKLNFAADGNSNGFYTVNKNEFKRLNKLLNRQNPENQTKIAQNIFNNEQNLTPNKNQLVSGFYGGKRLGSIDQKKPKQQLGRKFINETVSPRSKMSKTFMIKSRVFSAALTYKQCVNMLQYCRLIHRYLTVLRQLKSGEQSQSKILAGWLIYFVEEIHKKINEKGVIYDIENSAYRQKKMKEVATHYQQKYRSQFQGYEKSDLNLYLFRTFVRNFYEKVDYQLCSNLNSLGLQRGHYLLMIYDCTNMLRKCYDSQNYKSFSDYEQIEMILKLTEDEMDAHSYRFLKKKVTQNQSKSF